MYNSQKIANRIKSRAKEKKISVSTVLATCELGKNTVSKIGQGTDILTLNFAKIADCLDCSVDYLLGRTDVPEVNHSPKQIHPPVSNRVLAYYGKIAAAGQSVEFSSMISGTVECPLTDESRRADYVIGVSGDSMEPCYSDGDIVLVQKDSCLGIGDVGIFQKDNGIYIKEVGDGELRSFNKRYKPIADNGDILCLGKVIGKLEKDY